MGTAIENIFSAKLGREARAGELVIVEIDASVVQDVNAPPLTDALSSWRVCDRALPPNAT